MTHQPLQNLEMKCVVRRCQQVVIAGAVRFDSHSQFPHDMRRVTQHGMRSDSHYPPDFCHALKGCKCVPSMRGRKLCCNVLSEEAPNLRSVKKAVSFQSDTFPSLAMTNSAWALSAWASNLHSHGHASPQSKRNPSRTIPLGYEPIEWPTPAIYKMFFFIL